MNEYTKEAIRREDLKTFDAIINYVESLENPQDARFLRGIKERLLGLEDQTDEHAKKPTRLEYLKWGSARDWCFYVLVIVMLCACIWCQS